MKNKIKLIITLIHLSFLGFSQVNENFNDNNLLLNPVWQGEITKFNSTDGRLNLKNGDSSDVVELYTKSYVLEDFSWEATTYFGVNPSGQNYVMFNLLSTKKSLVEGTSIQLQMGSSKDNLKLLFVEEGKKTTLFESETLFINDSTCIQTKVELDSLRIWKIFIDTTCTNNFEKLGEVEFNLKLNPRYTGIAVKHTKTRKDKFHWDDFSVEGKIESFPPELVYSELEKDSLLKILFTEEIDLEQAEVKNEIGEDLTFFEKKEDTLIFTLSEKLQKGDSLKISITNVKDEVGNVMTDTTLHFYKSRTQTLQKGDLLFTEILADPSLESPLPNIEYVEVYNNSGKSIFSDGLFINGKPLPSGFEIAAKSYFLFVNEALLANEIQHIVVGDLPTYWLPNSKGEIVLSTKNSDTLDYLLYDEKWYNGSESDGYALERNNLEESCSNSSAFWKPMNNFGSPAKENTHRENTIPLKQKQKYWLVPDTLSLEFNQAVYTYEIDFFESGDFLLTTVLPVNVKLEVHPVCVLSEIIEVDLKLLEKPKVLLPVITEILYDANEQQTEFIELANLNNEAIYFDESYVVVNGDSSEMLPSIFLNSNEVIVLGDAVSWIKTEYENVKESSLCQFNIPSLSNEGGEVGFVTAKQKTLILYNNDLHSLVLENTKGVSLELFTVAGNNNWSSGTSETNYGSPTYLREFEQVESKMKNLKLTNNVLSRQTGSITAVVSSEFPVKIKWYLFDLGGNAVTQSTQEIILQASEKWEVFSLGDNLLPSPYVWIVESVNEKGVTEKQKFAITVTP